MRDRAMGVLFILSGVCFIAAVVNPPLLPTWGGSVPEVVRTASAHRTAWFTSIWLIALSVVGGYRGGRASVPVSRHRYGPRWTVALPGRTGLALASTIYDLSVTSTLLGAARLPGWYLGAEHWAEGLATAYFALLAPAAMVCFGVSILRTRRVPALGRRRLADCCGHFLFGQFAAFRGALPFPQFLAFIALGIAALMRSPAQAPPAGCQGRVAEEWMTT